MAPIFVERASQEPTSYETQGLPAAAGSFGDQTDSDHLEALVERGFEAFVEVGSALAEIRDRGLHSPPLPTFEQYCHQRWGVPPSRIRQLIAAVVGAQGISP